MASKTRILLRAKLPHLCCGLESDGVYILAAAPIMKWAIGKTVAQVENWIHSKSGELEIVEPRAIDGSRNTEN